MKRVILIFLLIPFIMECRAQNDIIFFSLVSSHENVSLEGNQVLALPTLGPYLVAGDKLYALDDSCKVKTISSSYDMPIEDMIWNGDDFVIKSLNHVFVLSNTSSPRLLFETDDYKIFPCEEGKIYVVAHRGNESYLYLANLKLKKAQRMVNLHGNVLNVAKRGSITWVSTNECVYRFEGEKCEIMFHFQEPINSVVMLDAGLVYATDSNVNLINEKNSYITLLKCNNHGVLYDEEWLYIITEQYDLVRCHKVCIDMVLMMMDALSEED